MLTIEETTQAVVTALEDIKAVNINIIDTSKRSTMFERMVIASANSPRQTRALADHVCKQLKLRGVEVVGTEGEDSGEWVLVDLGAVVVQRAGRPLGNAINEADPVFAPRISNAPGAVSARVA